MAEPTKAASQNQLLTLLLHSRHAHSPLGAGRACCDLAADESLLRDCLCGHHPDARHPV
jgi:hypothetical protein